ncbi:hypothetical protein Aduo_002488 [Ancylostoma duodenale]
MFTTKTFVGTSEWNAVCMRYLMTSVEIEGDPLLVRINKIREENQIADFMKSIDKFRAMGCKFDGPNYKEVFDRIQARTIPQVVKIDESEFAQSRGAKRVGEDLAAIPLPKAPRVEPGDK